MVRIKIFTFGINYILECKTYFTFKFICQLNKFINKVKRSENYKISKEKMKEKNI